MRIYKYVSVFFAGTLTAAFAQSLGGAGTIEGFVTDPSGAAVASARAVITNAISGYVQQTITDTTGRFRFSNVPPNPYHIQVTAPGFAAFAEAVTVRTTVPIDLKVSLKLAGEATTVTVEASGEHLLENVPYAHSDLDEAAFSKLPTASPGSSLSDAITLSSPGVVADSNGFFHPLGDHAQTTYSIDGQPISDQQSKQYSTQIPLNALQSMELITGAPAAEFGDKTSLVVNAQTRSGLGQKPFGSVVAEYGSFGTVSEESSLGFGGLKLGNFLVVNALRSGRFLDTPEFWPIHDIGNNGTIFDRLDYQPGTSDVFHLDLFGARNWFQVPNTYDQPNQDQRQRALTYNIAPGYQHTFNARTLLSASAFLRQDRVNYYPSADPFADTPATISQDRHLTNFGLKTDISYAAGRHDVKIGTQLMQTHLAEAFGLGITDPAALGTGLPPGLVPYDLTRGGSLFQFRGKADINEYALYAQDSITFRNLVVNGGLRIDRYDGLSQATGVEPRIGFSYRIGPSDTVIRGAYSRTFETPYNENLILSSATGQGGLATNVFGAYASQPIQPGRRNQFNAGLEQAVRKYLVIDADYFWKFTDNAFDFGTLFNTPIEFPISWRKSKIDGVAVRLATTNLHGFQATTTMGHTRARFFGPSNGGLIFNSPLDSSVFRIDHDEAFEQTTQLRYAHSKNGAWASLIWRYDSGEVAGAVPDLASALALTAAQQAAIGLYCGGQFAAVGAGISACNSPNYGATRLAIPAPGTANPDHNPPRIAPRNLFDIAVGTDNLLKGDRERVTLRFTVVNVTNNAALYNFLSTFSGTHFVQPRSYEMAVGLAF
jgi:hypothetical protein